MLLLVAVVADALPGRPFHRVGSRIGAEEGASRLRWENHGTSWQAPRPGPAVPEM